MLKLNKKGNVFDSLSALGIGVASLVIIFAVTFLIMSQTKAQIVTVESIDVTNTSTWTEGYNATNTLINATADVPDWVPLIIIASIGSILIGLVAMFGKR